MEDEYMILLQEMVQAVGLGKYQIHMWFILEEEILLQEKE